jgi:preprotein translocase subunit SecE
MVQVGLYKRSQGRITRQVTFTAIAITVTVGLWRLSILLQHSKWTGALGGIQYWLPGLLLALGLWISYRLVNMPRFADFLIAVEAEMAKVSWPSRPELTRASIIVLILLLLLAVVLGGYDLMWRLVFTHIIPIF